MANTNVLSFLSRLIFGRYRRRIGYIDTVRLRLFAFIILYRMFSLTLMLNEMRLRATCDVDAAACTSSMTKVFISSACNSLVCPVHKSRVESHAIAPTTGAIDVGNFVCSELVHWWRNIDGVRTLRTRIQISWLTVRFADDGR